ncbi:unnamed protein product [Soboliphyme baturini]|uniref:MULE domain-containing protein n=1 Tax=Soboliphyme baturini TaxID=241478 RepID=A0A183I9D6_9BILA|nr:unnamed protein product [Soboliphyme baturini]
MANLDLLQEHAHWFIAGTFKVAPPLIFQVFSIHVLVDGSAYSLVYVMMPDKTEESYKHIFRKLKEIKPALNLSSIMSDYEKASQNVCAIVFPDTRLFRLGQTMWRKVQDLNLAVSYCEDENFRIYVQLRKP